MQNYFAKITLPFAPKTLENPSTPVTSNKQQAVSNVTASLKAIQKKYEFMTKLLLSGLYKEKIDFAKLRNENEIYDVNNHPVPNNWFEHQVVKKKQGYYFFMVIQQLVIFFLFL